MTKQSLANFRKEAETAGLEAVTEDEYVEFVEKMGDRSTEGQIKRIKYHRKTIAKKIDAYAIGARDISGPKTPLSKSKNQVIMFLTKEGKMEEYSTRGNWSGQHGREHLIGLGEFQRKDGSRGYSIKSTEVKGNRWDHVRWNGWNNIKDYLEFPQPEEKSYPVIAVKGWASWVEYGTNFDAGKDKNGRFEQYDTISVPDYPSDYPTAMIKIRDKGIIVKAKFGPFKHSEPLIRIPDWNLKSCISIEDLRATLLAEDTFIGLIGSYSRMNDEADDDGNSMRYLDLNGLTAVVLPAEGSPPVFEMKEKVESDEGVSTPVQDVSSEVSSQMKAMEEMLKQQVEELKNKVREGLKILGEGATVETLKGGKFVDENLPDELIQSALNEVIKEVNGTVAKPPSPGVKSVKDESDISKDAKRIRNLIMANGGECTIDFIIAEAYSRYKYPDNITEEYIDWLIDQGEIWQPKLGSVGVIK